MLPTVTSQASCQTAENPFGASEEDGARGRAEEKQIAVVTAQKELDRAFYIINYRTYAEDAGRAAARTGRTPPVDRDRRHPPRRRAASHAGTGLFQAGKRRAVGGVFSGQFSVFSFRFSSFVVSGKWGLAPSRKGYENRRETLPARCLSPFSTGYSQDRPKMGTGSVDHAKHRCKTTSRRSQSPFSGSRTCSCRLSSFELVPRSGTLDDGRCANRAWACREWIKVR